MSSEWIEAFLTIKQKQNHNINISISKKTIVQINLYTVMFTSCTDNKMYIKWCYLEKFTKVKSNPVLCSQKSVV